MVRDKSKSLLFSLIIPLKFMNESMGILLMNLSSKVFRKCMQKLLANYLIFLYEMLIYLFELFCY